MPLRPVILDLTLIGQPLAWDLYTVSGVLVARAGMQINNADQLARLAARPLFRNADAGIGATDLVDRLRFVMLEYPQALRSAGTRTLEPAIRDLVRELIALARMDHDACLGLLRLLPMRDPAVRHSLLAALVALDLADLLELPDTTLEAVTAAAMTMNIAAIPLHAELSDGRLRFNPEIRTEMRLHPEHGRKLLEASGITDPVWLTAVHQHHENLDGSGYPLGLRGEAIDTPARIIRIADYYAAKVSGRRYRPPKSSGYAIKQLFGSEHGRLDSHYLVQLPRLLGLYPPGTLVRLATREIAVVTRKEGSGETAGHVMAFMDMRGHLLKAPVERNTAQVNFAVIGITEAESNWPDIGWDACWGY